MFVFVGFLWPLQLLWLTLRGCDTLGVAGLVFWAAFASHQLAGKCALSIPVTFLHPVTLREGSTNGQCVQELASVCSFQYSASTMKCPDFAPNRAAG